MSMQMAGLYIYVPFCAKRCLYRDSFSNMEMKYKEPYINALIKKTELRKGYIGNETLEATYFGEGTPPQLDEKDFGRIFEAIYRLSDAVEQTETTLKANPDDMERKYVSLLHNHLFNRVSIGAQSLHPRDLRFLNRRHDREQATKTVELRKECGITNISTDLIYEPPNQTKQTWEENLRQAIRLDIPHPSACHLIYKEGTVLYKLMETGEVTPVDEKLGVSFFSTLIDRLAEAGYLHYEISSFTRPGFLSKHNSSYWTGKEYLGLGPPVHSCNGINQEWNPSSLPVHMEGIENGHPTVESEDLDLCTQYDDFIITDLRTMWGVSLVNTRAKFGRKLLSHCQKQVRPHINQGLLLQIGDKLILSKSGVLASGRVMSDLFWV